MRSFSTYTALALTASQAYANYVAAPAAKIAARDIFTVYATETVTPTVTSTVSITDYITETATTATTTYVTAWIRTWLG